MNKQDIMNALSNKNVIFFFEASSDLKNIIVKGEAEEIQGFPEAFSKILLEGNGIKISNNMIFDYYNNNLDAKNKFILDRGMIRILNNDVIL